MNFQDMQEEPDSEKEKRIRNINNLYAFDLFCQHKFEESMKIFDTLGTGNYVSLLLTSPLTLNVIWHKNSKNLPIKASLHHNM